jgi:hypothetical protein
MQGHAEVRKVLAPLVNGERRIGVHKNIMPKGWRVITASNRTGDKSGTGAHLAFITNRVARVSIRADHQGFQAYARATCPDTLLPHVHPLVARWIEQRPHNVAEQVPADPSQPFTSFRSIERASRLLCAYLTPETYIDGIAQVTRVPGLQTLLGGIIGHPESLDLFQMLQVAAELPTRAELLANPATCKLPPAHMLDVQYAAAQMALFIAGPQTVDACAQYIGRLRTELLTATYQRLLADNPAALDSPTLAKWVATNPDLVSATFAR